MRSDQVDGTAEGRIRSIAREILEGAEIRRVDAAWLFGLTDSASIMHLLAWANRVREHYHGNRIHLCSIVNIKAGGCSENCKFCAQSALYETASPRHGLVDEESVWAASAEARRNGVGALGLVAAWAGLQEGPVLDTLCSTFEKMKAQGKVRPDASLGMIRSQVVADRLRAAGVECYNHNLESSQRFYTEVCTSHSYDDRVQTLHFLRNAGIRLCSGGILGMGETPEDRCELALTLKEVGADIVPLNFLNPIAGTPFQNVEPLPPLQILKAVACFRLTLPKQIIMVAGGRVVNLRDLQCMLFQAGANGLMVGNYLTTVNQPVEKDLQMLKDLGLEPVGCQPEKVATL